MQIEEPEEIHERLARRNRAHHSSRRARYIIIGIIVFAAVGVAAWLVVGLRTQAKNKDQDERLSYCERYTTALYFGNDDHNLTLEEVKRAMWDKWKMSAKELA